MAAALAVWLIAGNAAVEAQEASPPAVEEESAAPVEEPPVEEPAPPPVAVLRALDKVTARVTTLEVSLGETAQFGSLLITPRACDKAPPEERPESTAFLEIDEVKSGQPAKAVFRGWMFASSPGLSAMEHPAYDVWLLDCASKDDKAADQDSRPGAE